MAPESLIPEWMTNNLSDVSLVELGSISLGPGASPVRTGNKIRALAEDLRLGVAAAATLGMAVAEAVRSLTETGEEGSMEVQLQREGNNVYLEIAMDIEKEKGQKVAALVKPAFDRVEVSGGLQGICRFKMSKRLPSEAMTLSQGFVGRAKAALERLSEKELLLRLERERSFLQATLDALTDVFLVFEPQGRVLKWNRRLVEITGLRDGEIAAIGLCDLLEGRGISLREELERMGEERGRGSKFLKVWLRGREGRRIPCEMAISPFQEATGKAGGLCAVVRDVSEREAMEEELRRVAREMEEAKERAEGADRLKSAFLATMSHELRTPLNSIIGFTGILLQGLAGPLNEEQTKQLNIVRHSASHLLELINDILDLSKIEAGQMEIHPAPLDLKELIEGVERTMRPLAETKGLDIIVSCPPEVGIIDADRKRLEQVLLNLMGNAIKFTETGWVSLECSREEGKVRFSVRDTGPGIKEEDMGRLFTPFQQLDMSSARVKEGTGLGLSICRRLVEMMGGEIGVESECGKGSHFYFYLSA